MNATKTKIALVNTPLLEGAGDHPLFAPLGLAYMAAVLEQNNFEVKVFDCPIYGIDHENLKKELSAYQPNIVGVGAMTQTYESALKTAYAAKEVCPDAKIVMGGPHATFQDKEILTQEKVVDIIVRGEGEETLLELAKQPDLQNIGDIKGITYRNGGEIVQTPTRPFIKDLDALPRPDYKQIPIEKYRINGKRILPIISSRGCPFQCSFCVASEMFGRTFRARSPKNVLDEIEWLKNDYGAEGIQFQDDTFSFDKKRAMDICDGMIERKINLKWGCGTRADVTTKELLEKMHKAGCDEICFGVESGCQRIRDSLKKKVTTEQCENAIKWSKETGIFTTVSIILGYPGETRETVQESLDFVRKVEPDSVWLNIPTPYPGTELRAIVQSKGWKMTDDWNRYNTMNPIFEDPDLPAEEVLKARMEFYNKFYSFRYFLRQAVKGYLHGSVYSKIMARTAANYIIMRTMSRK
jgi:radical SAM superfamily enzyme YgiQ (UPF0313 family)